MTGGLFLFLMAISPWMMVGVVRLLVIPAGRLTVTLDDAPPVQVPGGMRKTLCLRIFYLATAGMIVPWFVPGLSMLGYMVVATGSLLAARTRDRSDAASAGPRDVADLHQIFT
jgi:hypothetical protein